MKTTSTSKELTLQLADTTSFTTNLSVDFVTADQIGVSYNTMPGNQPNTYGNFLALWQNQDTIPWNQAPLKTFPIQTNTQAGSAAFNGLDVTNNSYVIGYSVGPVLTQGEQYGNICATAFIPAVGTQSNSTTFSSSLTIVSIGTTSVAFNYELPANSTPLANTAWCGIWRSSVPSYNNPPDATIPVTLNASSGTLAFNDFPIGRGLTYTIALFTSGWQGFGMPNNQKAMACSVTFTNS